MEVGKMATKTDWKLKSALGEQSLICTITFEWVCSI
jgi:hypothetical protein